MLSFFRSEGHERPDKELSRFIREAAKTGGDQGATPPVTPSGEDEEARRELNGGSITNPGPAPDIYLDKAMAVVRNNSKYLQQQFYNLFPPIFSGWCTVAKAHIQAPAIQRNI